MYESQYLSTVLAPQGFVLLCTSVRCESHRPLCGASLQRLCASVYCTSSESFVRCEPTKALCFGVLYELRELCAVRAYKGFVLWCTVRAPRALCGASLQRLNTVCARACASGTVRAPRALWGASLQRLCASVYRKSAESFARCESTKALCLCVLYEPHELCAVRACKGFIYCSVHCTSLTSFVRCEPTKALYGVHCFPQKALN